MNTQFVTTRRLIVLVLIACAAAFCLGRTKESARAQAKPAGNQLFANGEQRGQSSGAQTEKTVEQVQKNIKVLTGLPQSQLIPVMNLMSVSLGVKCNYCHVNKDGNWIFDSDDKPEKSTAREMITMVMNINKTTFRGNTEVSCITCHQGKTHPTSVISFPLPEETRPPRPAPAGNAAAPAAPQPTADDILGKYLAALGGESAIGKLKSRMLVGSFVNAQGMNMTYEIEQSGPDKFYVSFKGPRGWMERGFNGSIAWERSPQGVHEIAGQQLAELKRFYQLLANVKLKEQFTRLNVGRDKLNDRDVFVLRGTSAEGSRERLYFDAESGLLVRRVSVMQTPLGIIPQQVDFADYREVEGVKMPFTIRVSAVDTFNTATHTFTEIKVNTAVDEMKFNKPAPAP